MIIDCHTHIFPDEVRRGRAKYAQKDLAFGEIYRDEKAKMEGVEELIGSMDEAGVDKAVVCGFPWLDSALCAAGNDYILEGMRRFPERITGFGCIQPNDGDEAIEEVERCISLGMKGIGELASYTCDLSSYDIGSMKPICEILEKADLPLMLHANEMVGWSPWLRCCCWSAGWLRRSMPDGRRSCSPGRRPPCSTRSSASPVRRRAA